MIFRFFNDPAGGTRLRLEIATRIAIGTAVALCFGIAWWYKSPLKCMSAILAVTFAFLTPPYLGSSVMVMSIMTMGILASLGALTGAILFGATYFEGLPTGEVQGNVAYATYGILAAYWLIIVPPCKTSSLQIGLLVLTVAVAVPIYALGAMEDTLLTGVIFGYSCGEDNCGDVLTTICSAAGLQASKVGGYDGFLTATMFALCGNSTHVTQYAEALNNGQVLCLPFDEVDVEGLSLQLYPELTGNTEAIQAMHMWDGQQFCVGHDPKNPTVMWGMVKPGTWLLDFLWFYMDYRTGAFMSFFFSALIAGACVFLMSFIPPARFATDRLRTLIRDQMLRLRSDRLPASLPGGIAAHGRDLALGVSMASSIPQDPLPAHCSIGPTSGRKKLFAIDEPVFAAMDTIGALTVVEINFLDPGPFVALWPSYRKIIPMMRTLSEHMVLTAFLGELSELTGVDEPQEALLGAVDRLMFEMAFCMSLRPTTTGSAQFNTELMCLHLEEKVDAVKDAAANWTTVTEIGTTAEQKILIEGHRLAALQMSGTACAIAEGIMGMMKNHCKASVSGFLTVLFGMLLPIIAIFAEIFKFWGGVFSFWRFSWKGDWSWWKDPRFLGVIQFFIAIVICLMTFGFFTDIRRFQVLMVNPVYFLPSGRLGQWVTVPIAMVLLHSSHGTICRAPLRMLGLLIGALVGIPALLFLRWGRMNGVESMAGADFNENTMFWGNFATILYLSFVVFVCVFSSVDTTGRLSMYGTFHNQYAYGPFMVAYFATIICTEGVDLTTNLIKGQPAPYSVSDYVLVRIIGQAFGVGACVFVSLLIPIRAGAHARGLSSQCLRLLSRALLTGIQNWRGDDIEEAAEKEAVEDMAWSLHGRQRVNNFIMEMDGLGRLRSIVGDHFCTFFSGDRGDLPALRTLHHDLSMFIALFMKGCRAPIGDIPPELDQLAHAVDCWAIASAKRICYIANGQYTKLQGIQTPSDEALNTFNAFKKAHGNLIEIAEHEAMDMALTYEDEKAYDISAEYEEAKESQTRQMQGINQLEQNKSFDEDEILKSISEVMEEEESRRASAIESAEAAVRPSRGDSLMGCYASAETALEADQRWQLLIANMVALECAIFSALPDDTKDADQPRFSEDSEPYLRYGYGYGDSEAEKDEDDEFKGDYTYNYFNGEKAEPRESVEFALKLGSPKKNAKKNANTRSSAKRKDVAVAQGQEMAVPDSRATEKTTGTSTRFEAMIKARQVKQTTQEAEAKQHHLAAKSASLSPDQPPYAASPSTIRSDPPPYLHKGDVSGTHISLDNTHVSKDNTNVQEV